MINQKTKWSRKTKREDYYLFVIATINVHSFLYDVLHYNWQKMDIGSQLEKG